MMTSLLDFQKIRNEVLNMADSIICSNFDDLLNITKENQEESYIYLNTKNPENLENGISGVLLFLLEVYSHTQEVKYLNYINFVSEELINYCRNNNTHNWSLYKGRCGFAYFLIRLHDVTGEKAILDDFLELILQYDYDNPFAKTNSSYLYDGHAGYLITLVALYLNYTENELLKTKIDICLRFILENATFCKNGLSWKSNEEINIKNSIGFAYGSSGIRYVLHCLLNNFQADYFHSIMNGIYSYLNENVSFSSLGCLNYEKDILDNETLKYTVDLHKEKYENLYKPIYDFSWRSGLIGFLLSSDLSFSNLHERFTNANLSNNIIDGLSGIALYMLHIGEHKMANSLLEHIFNNNFILSRKSLKGGLLWGDLGVYYLMIKILKQNDSDSIISPFAELKQNRDNKSKLGLSNFDFKYIIISKFYKRTLRFIKEIDNGLLGKLIEGIKMDLCNNILNEFEENILLDSSSLRHNTHYSKIVDVAKLENNIKRLEESSIQESNCKCFIECFLKKNEIINKLNRDDSWFEEQYLQVSANITFFESKWDWNPETDFAINVTKEEESFEYIFFKTTGKYEELSLYSEAFILHNFDKPIKIKNMISDLKFYFNYLPNNILDPIAKSLGADTIEDFLNRLDFLLLYKIKYYIFNHVLEFVE